MLLGTHWDAPDRTSTQVKAEDSSLAFEACMNAISPDLRIDTRPLSRRSRGPAPPLIPPSSAHWTHLPWPQSQLPSCLRFSALRNTRPRPLRLSPIQCLGVILPFLQLHTPAPCFVDLPQAGRFEGHAVFKAAQLEGDLWSIEGPQFRSGLSLPHILDFAGLNVHKPPSHSREDVWKPGGSQCGTTTPPGTPFSLSSPARQHTPATVSKLDEARVWPSAYSQRSPCHLDVSSSCESWADLLRPRPPTPASNLDVQPKYPSVQTADMITKALAVLLGHRQCRHERPLPSSCSRNGPAGHTHQAFVQAVTPRWKCVLFTSRHPTRTYGSHITQNPCLLSAPLRKEPKPVPCAGNLRPPLDSLPTRRSPARLPSPAAPFFRGPGVVCRLLGCD